MVRFVILAPAPTFAIERRYLVTKKMTDPDIHSARVTTVQEYFGLTDGEVEMIDCRIGLANAMKDERAARGLSQTAFAKLVGVSQARASEIERGDAAVSFDLMAEAFFALGKTRRDLARVLDGEVFRPETSDVPVKRSPRAKRASRSAATAGAGPARKASKRVG